MSRRAFCCSAHRKPATRTSASSSRASRCAKRRKQKVRRRLEDLEEFSAGLICLTGGDEGPLAPALAQDGLAGARKIIDRLASIYGRGNLYLELQRHQQREEECRNQSLLNLASELCQPVDSHQWRSLCN